MAKRVFFSFHYQDVIDFRVNVVRNHWITKLNREDAGFFDSSLWENSKNQGDYALKRLINSGLENTSVTCVLIGTETYNRPWVRYEIVKSHLRGNKVFGVHINSIAGLESTKPQGTNPFEYLGITISENGKTETLWEKENGNWFEYSRVDSMSTYGICQVANSDCGKGFNFSQFFSVFDWTHDCGYENFAKWVDD